MREGLMGNALDEFLHISAICVCLIGPDDEYELFAVHWPDDRPQRRIYDGQWLASNPIPIPNRPFTGCFRVSGSHAILFTVYLQRTK